MNYEDEVQDIIDFFFPEELISYGLGQTEKKPSLEDRDNRIKRVQIRFLMINYEN
jgi:hypothetical protein